ncbi:hypothetical protein [Muricoccus nepalensis]|uniref:hypothetical protein n=1 Tax=Muricoccus nepalensis TaxID=1854500 RepID=UPI00112BEA14|nr:hypothetical protein [Roseomonas nepalensis]
MPPTGPLPSRRRALRVAALGLAAAALRDDPARAQGPEGATILAPGPEDGAGARWAARAAGALSRGMQRPGAMRLAVLGGPDGVTAANRFATLDGSQGPSLLALPGWTCHARLVGSTRARFEPRGWLPLLLSWQGAVLAGRGPLPGAAGAPLRVAMPSAEAPEAAALAALDLLGLPGRPFAGLPEAAFAAGEADALILAGPEAAARAQTLGATPWCAFPGPAEAEAAEAPPFPTGSPLAQAVVAAVAAMQVRAALVAPALTAADTVAAWRRAGSRWQEEERALPGEGQPLAGAAAASAFALLLPPPDAVLDYRSWLDRRLGWRAG